MRFRGNRAPGRFKGVAAVLLILSAVVLEGCDVHHPKTATYGTHRVTLKREGITNRFGVEDHEQRGIFHYDGYGRAGNRLKVTIEKHRVSVDDKVVGMLRQGDALYIDDEGITVNALGHGETQEYLRANLAQETARTR